MGVGGGGGGVGNRSDVIHQHKSSLFSEVPCAEVQTEHAHFTNLVLKKPG